MPYPVVESLTPTIFSVDATAHLVAMPAVVGAGDLLIILFTNDSDDTVTTPAGWTLIWTTSDGGNIRLSGYYKIAAGTEDGTTVDVVTSGVEKGAAHVYRISGWHGTTPPEAAVAAVGNAAGPNPPSLSPSWGAEATLWLAVVGTDGAVTTSVYPGSYTDGLTSAASGAGNATVISARRELNDSPENPSALTISATEQFVAQTVAIRPGPEVIPDAPTDLEAVATSSTEITLDWLSEPPPEGTRIERSPDGVGSWAEVGAITLPESPLFFDTGLTPNTPYFYRVIAFNAAGDSAPSGVATTTTFITATVAVVVGACWGGASLVTITVTPAVGAIIEVENEAEVVTAGNAAAVSLLTGTYTWAVEAAAGYEATPSSGTFVVCPLQRTVRGAVSSSNLAD